MVYWTCMPPCRGEGQGSIPCRVAWSLGEAWSSRYLDMVEVTGSNPVGTTDSWVA